MAWRWFAGLTEAQDYCAAQTALMGLSDGDVTTEWTVPMLLADGSYVAQAYQDNSAVPWEAAWIPAEAAAAGGWSLAAISDAANAPAPEPVAEPVDPAIASQAQFAALMAGGLAVSSASTPAVNGVYAVDATAQGNFAAVQVYVLTHNAFPLGAAQSWPLMGGQMVTIPSVAVFTAIATAAAQFVAALDSAQAVAAQGGDATWPAGSVSIP